MSFALYKCNFANLIFAVTFFLERRGLFLESFLIIFIVFLIRTWNNIEKDSSFKKTFDKAEVLGYLLIRY